MSPETVPSGVELEQPFSVLFTPRKQRMKQELMKVRTLLLNKNIKMLSQKVRRLQNRNKSLKDILKTLKDENYIDSFFFLTD